MPSTIDRIRVMSGIEEREQTPTVLKHCVAAVGKKYGGDTSKAYAICTAQLQKSGKLEPGTQQETAEGEAASGEHERDPRAAEKLAAYEKMIKRSKKERKDESVMDRMRQLAGIDEKADYRP